MKWLYTVAQEICKMLDIPPTYNILTDLVDTLHQIYEVGLETGYERGYYEGYLRKQDEMRETQNQVK